MSTTTEDKLRIPPSPELFVEALKTLPLKPEHGSITFSADGLYRPISFETPEQQAAQLEHVRECEAKNIIPYSHSKLLFDFSERNRGFYHEKTYLEVPQTLLKHGVRDKALLKMMGGGRIHRVTVSLGEYVSEHSPAFQHFRETLLDPMLQLGYQVREGSIWLSSTYGGDCYTKGHSPDSTLLLDSLSNEGEFLAGGLELRLGWKLTPERKASVETWFTALSQKYKK